MRNLFLSMALLLLFTSCNDSTTSNKLNNPSENYQAKALQSSAAKSTETVKNNKSQPAGSIKNDSTANYKAGEARSK